MTARGPYDVRTKLELTERQEQVLDLVAKGYTNAQVGEALGITLDGAKWHVSEIITKLGVSTREEAADYWRDYRRPTSKLRRSWAGLVTAVSFKWGVAATASVVVVAGLAVFVALLLGDEGEASPAADESPPATPTPTPPIAQTPEPTAPSAAAPGEVIDLLEQVDAALRSIGDVGYLHANVESTWQGETEKYATVDVWFDSESDAVRLHWVKDPSVTADVEEERVELDSDGFRYYVDIFSSPRIKQYSLADRTECYDGEPELAVTALMCAFTYGHAPSGTLQLEARSDFEGRTVLPILMTTDGFEARLLIDEATHLPVALTGTPPDGGADITLARYEVAALPRNSVGDDYFDPAAFGWVDPDDAERQAMDEVGERWAIYWLGDSYEDPQGRVFQRVSIDDYRVNGEPAEPGVAGPGHVLAIQYGSDAGRARLDYWPVEAWPAFVERVGTAFQWAECSDQRVVPVAGGELTILRGFELPQRPPGNPTDGSDPGPPDLFPGECPDRPYDRFMAVVTYADVVVTINAPYGWGPDSGDVYGVFDTEEALVAVAQALEKREPGTP